MKVYVSGPMRGHHDLNFPAFRSAAAKLRAVGHEVFDPSEQGDEDDPIRECLARDLAWICEEADAIALLPGWRLSTGALAERATGIALGLEIWEL